MELALLSERISCNGYFVFTLDSGEEETLVYGRMFAPAIGITEDPVTGNANGPLGGYLVQNRIVSFEDNYFEFNAKQGEKINRLGTINVSVTSENNIPKEIKIKGNAVVIFKTELSL
jgi:PhzF family phenazine biosynthesis protein